MEKTKLYDKCYNEKAFDIFNIHQALALETEEVTLEQALKYPNYYDKNFNSVSKIKNFSLFDYIDTKVGFVAITGILVIASMLVKKQYDRYILDNLPPVSAEISFGVHVLEVASFDEHSAITELPVASQVSELLHLYF